MYAVAAPGMGLLISSWAQNPPGDESPIACKGCETGDGGDMLGRETYPGSRVYGFSGCGAWVLAMFAMMPLPQSAALDREWVLLGLPLLRLELAWLL